MASKLIILLCVVPFKNINTVVGNLKGMWAVLVMDCEFRKTVF